MIFSTKDNTLTILGSTLDELKKKFNDFKKIAGLGGLFGKTGILSTLLKDSKKSPITPELLGEFEEFKDLFNHSKLSAEALAEELGDVNKQIVNYASTCRNGALTTDGFKRSLQGITVGAKAASLAMKALSIAGNMVVMFLITKTIGAVINAFDNYIHRVEKTQKALESSKATYESISSEIRSLEEELNTCEQKINDINKLGGANIAKDGELEKLEAQHTQLEANLALAKEAQYLAAKDLAANATEAYNTPIGTHYINQQTQDTDQSESRILGEVTPAKELEYAINEYRRLKDELIAIDQQIINKQAEIAEARNSSKGTWWLERSLESLENKQTSINSYMEDARERANEMAVTVNNVAETSQELIDSGYALIEEQDASFKEAKAAAQEYNNFLNEIQPSTPLTQTEKNKGASDSPPGLSVGVENTIKEIDDYQQKFNALSSAIQKVKEQKLSSSELLDLKQEFPELIGETGDLGVALDNLVDETLTKVIDYLKRIGASDDFIKIFRQLAAEVKGLADEADFSYTDVIEELNKMTGAFTALDTAYANFIAEDKNITFDNLSAISEQFKEVSGIDSYIKAIQDAKGDTEATQKAFDNLSIAYIKHTGILDRVNDSNAALIQSYLEEQGYLYAEELVTSQLTLQHEQLAAEKYYNANASINLQNATIGEINEFVNSANAADVSKQALAELALQKIVANNVQIETASDIDQVISLANAAGASATVLARLAAAKAILAKAETNGLNGGAGDFKQLEYAKALLEEIENGTFDYGIQIDPEKYKRSPYKGSNPSINSGSGSDKNAREKAPTTKDFDWISRRQDLLQKLHNQEIEDADDAAKSYETRIALIDDLIAKDNERLEFNKKAAETYTNAWEEAQAKILEEAAKQGEDGHAIIQNIMEGNDANQTFTDKADQNLIEAIEAGIDAQDNLNAIQEKSEETNKEITEHLEKQKELKLALVQAQIDIVKAEMDGLDAEIQLMEASGKVVGEKQLKKQIRLSEDLAENYYDRISALEDQLIDADENSAEYHSLMSEIYQCEAAIAECAVQQAEWNDQIKRLPIERINKFLELLGFVKEDLQNFIDQQNALGKTTSLPQFQELININLKQLEQLLDQQGKLAALLNDYEYGSEKYQETSSDLQDIDNEISSLIQSQTEWNKAILQIPLDSITKTNDTLQNAVTAMSDLLSDYDTAISAVTNVLDKQIGSINDLKDAASNEYETKIKPFQDELDLLQKQNDARRIQLDLEQSAYDLARAQDQKTNKVIRDGEITYEADEEAIRSAQNAKNDADYNKVVHDLEAQISGLEEERDKLLEGYDLQIEKLDEIKDRWSSITEEIKLAADSLKADDVLGAGWQDKILSGSDAGIFNSLKDLYTTISDQKNQYEQQITSNERITDMMNQFMESWQNGSITYDQAMAGIKDLAVQMKDGYSSLEHLDALMNLNGATDLGTLLSQMQISADASVNQFEDYMKVVKENADALEKYNSSWEEMQQNIRDQIAALEKLAKEAEKVADNIERHSSSSGSGGGSKGPNTSDNTYVKNGPGHTEEKLADAIANGKEIREYHKGGVVGGAKTTVDLKNDEVFAKLEMGERVITHDQQEAYKATLRQLLEGNYSPAMSVMPMHDMMPVEKYESRPAEVNINMGDITLPNVTSVDEFVHDFGQHIDPMLSQAFSKVFR